jgi:hypothetical protein
VRLRARLRLHISASPSGPTEAMRSMLVVPGAHSGTPATMMTRWPAQAIAVLERDDLSSNRHRALSFCLSMIFSENRCPLFRIML